MSRTLTFSIFCLFLLVSASAQHQVDSLKNLLNQSRNADTQRVKLYIALSDEYCDIDSDLGLQYSDSAISLSKKLKDENLMGSSHLSKGKNYAQKGEISSAQANYFKAFNIFKKTKNLENEAVCSHNLAYTYSITGNNRKAIELETRSYKILMKLGNKKKAVNALNSIGVNYFYLSNFRTAVDFYLKSLKLAEEVHSEKDMAVAYENIALVYKRLGNHRKAYGYYEKSLKICKKINYIPGLINVYTNYGAAKDQNNEPRDALSLYRKGLKLAIETKNKRLEYGLYTNIGISQIALKNYVDAFKNLKIAKIYYEANNDRNIGVVNLYYTEALLHVPDEVLKSESVNPAGRYRFAIANLSPLLEEAIKDEDLETEIQIRDMLSKAYEKEGRPSEALAQLRKFTKLKDSIYNFENSSQILEKEHRYEIEKERIISDAKIQHQKLIKQISIGIGVFIIVTGVVMFIGFRKRQSIKQQQKELLLRARISDIELKALRLQMNPHFIFNSLNSISDYIQKNDTQKADFYLTKFAKLMRGTLENSEEREIPIAEELKMLELYMDLEKSRLKDKFSFEIRIDNDIDTEHTYIPPLILQPFVENSIWHGITNMEGEGKILIHITKDNSMLNCIVEDNGVGRDVGKSGDRKSFGMKITKDRLEVLNKMKNANSAINLVDLEKGTRVEVKLPLEDSEV
jgi:tetratricopeptide (TPR) repeat protein